MAGPPGRLRRQFAPATLLQAPPALLNSLSNAGWSGVTALQFEALVANATYRALLDLLPIDAVALVEPRVIGDVSQFFVDQNLTHVNLTLVNATTYFANATWLSVAALDDSTARNVTAAAIAELAPSSVSALRGAAVHTLPDVAFAGFNSAQLAAMRPTAVANITELDVVLIAPTAFLGLCNNLDYLSVDAALNTSAAQLDALALSSCRGPQVCAFVHNISDLQREAVIANSTAFASLSETCGLTGETWVTTATIAMCIVTVAVFFACCVVVELRRKKRNRAALPR